MKICCDCSNSSIFDLNQNDLFSSVIKYQGEEFTRISLNPYLRKRMEQSKYYVPNPIPVELPTDYFVPKGITIDVSRGKINEDEQFHYKYSIPKIYINLDAILMDRFTFYEGIKVQDINIDFCRTILSFEPAIFFSLSKIDCDFYEQFISTRTSCMNEINVIRLGRDDLFLSALTPAHKRVIIMDTQYQVINYAQQQLYKNPKVKLAFCHINFAKDNHIPYSSYRNYIEAQFNCLYKEQFIF